MPGEVEGAVAGREARERTAPCLDTTTTAGALAGLPGFTVSIQRLTIAPPIAPPTRDALPPRPSSPLDLICPDSAQPVPGACRTGSTSSQTCTDLPASTANPPRPVAAVPRPASAMFRTALRTVAPRALPRVQAPVARSLLTSAVRLSEHQEPIIQGASPRLGSALPRLRDNPLDFNSRETLNVGPSLS